MTLQIPIQAQFDDAELQKALTHLVSQINQVGGAVADANKLKFNPIDKATLQDLKTVTGQIESLKKISNDLRRRMKGTGQEKTDFFDLDWSKMYVDPAQRSRQMRKAYEYVTAGTGASFVAPPAPTPATPTPGNPGGGSGGGGRRPGGGGGGGAANDPDGGGKGPGTPAWRRTISSSLRAAGPVGGVADEALSTGLSGGAMAGLAGLAGGMVALGLGKLISGIREKIGAAETDNVNYDKLKRQLGDVGVSFDALKESIHAVSNGLGLTYQEGQRLGAEFARLAGLSAQNYKTLGDEVNNAGGFARSFGLDPAQATQFFAQMRQFQATSNVTDSQRLALMIGESIAKSGAFAKSDEMLQAISSYTSQQTRLGLTTANVEGYTGLLTSLVGSHTPGLDPTGAAGMLSRVNSSIAGGGSAGEAGQNFMYMTLGKSLGLDPIQTRMLMQQGAFGTAARTFGRGTLAGNWMRDNGVGVSSAALGSNATNLEVILDAIKRRYSGNAERRELGLNAGANLLGINESAFAALSQMKPADVGSLSKRLQRLNIDLGKLDATNINSLAQIDSDKTLSEAEKDKRIAAAAPKSQMETIGSDIRNNTARLSNVFQDYADKAVPLLNEIRAGVLYFAGDKGKTGPMAIREAVASGQHTENVDHINSDAKQRIQALRGADTDLKMHQSDLERTASDPRSTKEQREQAEKLLADLKEKASAAKKQILDIERERADLLAKEQARYDEEVSDIKQSMSGDTKGQHVSAGVPIGTEGSPSPGAGGGAPSADKAAFIKKYDAYAGEVAEGTGTSKRLILAQLALETGWGKSELPDANNPFNVQAYGWNGPTVNAMDKDADGKPYLATFRKYKSLHESAQAQIAMMKRKYPGVIGAGDDAEKYVTNLKGYAESRTYSSDYQNVAASVGKQMHVDMADAEKKKKIADEKKAAAKAHIEITHKHETPAGTPITTIKTPSTTVSAPIAYGGK